MLETGDEIVMEVRGGVKCETGVVVLMSYVVQWEKSLRFGKGEDG